jgi:hypothetical protein
MTSLAQTFDVVNPVAMAILIPVAWVAGEVFCRLWTGPIIFGLFTAISFGSLLFGRPLIADWIPSRRNTHNPVVARPSVSEYGFCLPRTLPSKYQKS